MCDILDWLIKSWHRNLFMSIGRDVDEVLGLNRYVMDNFVHLSGGSVFPT